VFCKGLNAMSNIKRIAIITAIFSLTFSTLIMTGCNTVEGLGDDLKGASQGTKKVITGDDDKK
jgi:predicted small secreted protein